MKRLIGLIVGLHLIPAAGVCSADDSALEPIDVYTSGTGGYHTYRIPALVVSPDGTLLAFCEGRKSSRSDDGDIDMLLRRSTDGGQSWQPVQLIHEEGGNTTIKFGNPCPVVDRMTGTVWLTMNRSTGANRSERAGGDIFVTFSRDDGKTWSEPQDITNQVKKPDWKHYAQGPGIGIQLQHGPHRGRLVVPANFRYSFNNRDPSYSHVMFSDDHGKTWQLGGIVGPHTNECQVVEIQEDGKPGLLINMRNHWGRAGKPELSGKRLVSRSFDGGRTWTKAVPDPALVEPVCQASLLRYSWAGDGEPSRILFCNPAGRRRANLTVKLSEDEGHTWTVGKTIYAGSAAYCSLARLPDGRVGVLFERDDYGKLSFVTFPVSWLSESP